MTFGHTLKKRLPTTVISQNPPVMGNPMSGRVAELRYSIWHFTASTRQGEV